MIPRALRLRVETKLQTSLCNYILQCRFSLGFYNCLLLLHKCLNSCLQSVSHTHDFRPLANLPDLYKCALFPSHRLGTSSHLSPSSSTPMSYPPSIPESAECNPCNVDYANFRFDHKLSRANLSYFPTRPPKDRNSHV